MTYKIISTENYLLIVDDSQITEGDYCLANAKTYNNEIVTYRKSPCPPPFVSNLNILKRIIAHLPLNGTSILDGVDLLPPLEDDVEELAKEFKNSYKKVGVTDYEVSSFTVGFNKAKEKYKYTEEDLVRVFNIGVNSQFESTELKLNKDESFDRHSKNLLKLIQSLQQPKYPIGFECEMIKWVDELYCMVVEEPKKTTNNGLTQWVGTYIV